MSLGIAFKLFFKALGNPAFAQDAAALMAKPALSVPKAEAEPAAPRRTDAVELLATLQREGRLIDFLKEKLDAYSDAQIGAAVRDIHRDCAKTLDRLFGIAPQCSQPENSSLSLPADIDPGEWKLTGRVGGEPKLGQLRHHGWKITRHELPAWTGRPASAWVIAPAEVEI